MSKGESQAERQRRQEVEQELGVAIPKVAETDISILPELGLIIVAQVRQAYCNDAFRLGCLIGLAKMRDARDEVKTLGKQWDTMVLNITNLDKAHPGAKKRMDEDAAKAKAEGKL